MLLQEFVPSNDELRMVQGAVEFTQTYDVITHHPLFAPIMLAAFFAVLLLSIPRTRRAVSGWAFAWSSYVFGTWGRYRMRKDRFEVQAERQVDLLINHIQKEVDKHWMTPEEAKGWYQKYAKIHPILRHALKAPDDVKEAIKARRLSMVRDPSGKVVPLPLPGQKQEVPAKEENWIVHVL